MATCGRLLFLILAMLLMKSDADESLNCRRPADLMFLMDGSDSIPTADWNREKEFVSGLIDQFEVGTDFVRAGLVVYSTDIGDVIGLLPSWPTSQLRRLIGFLQQDKLGTNTAMGIQKMREIFRDQGRSNVPQIAIVITDGRSTDTARTIAQARLAKDEGIRMIAVGVGSSVFEEELRHIATNERKYFSVTSFQDLHNLISTLRDLICKAILTTPPPTTTPGINSPDGLCAGCIIDNGVGYNPYPNDCNKYVQCYKTGSTYRAQIRSCPHGMFWHQDSLTCVLSSSKQCIYDPCLSLKQGTTYEYRGACRAYWLCKNSRSLAMCCKAGQSYLPGHGCIRSTLCRKSCPPKENTDSSVACALREYKSDRRFYIEHVPWGNVLVRPCARGSIFDETVCGCKYSTTEIEDEQCKPAAQYNFNKGLASSDGKHISAGVSNVTVTSGGMARFSGNSEINIWRFAGVEYGREFVLQFQFRLDGSPSGDQAVITNCNGRDNQGPSVAILASASQVTFQVKTYESGQATLSLPIKLNYLNDVAMIYTGSQLIAKVNGKYRATPLTGWIERRQAGLLIGACEGYQNFKGELDNVSEVEHYESITSIVHPDLNEKMKKTCKKSLPK